MRQGEIWLIAILAVVLLELIQVCSQQLTHKEEVLLQKGYSSLKCLPRSLPVNGAILSADSITAWERAGSLKHAKQKPDTTLVGLANEQQC